MPELSVTEAQRERLETVRADVEAAYVDTYGTTRLRDAVAYLLDTYTPPDEREVIEAYDRIATAEYPKLQRVASDVPDVPGSGIETEEMRGRLLSALGPVAFAAELERAAKGDESIDADTDESTDADTGESATAGPGTPDPDSTTDDEPSAADDESTAGGETGGTEPGPPPRTPNRLLREHDDRWHESDGETPYEVELPDGTTESARTRDDVRQLLFRHYS